MIIYLVTNKINNKKYIGQTTRTLKERWSQHCTPSALDKGVLHKAILKYGKENFNLEIIREAYTLDELNVLEIELISQYKTIAPNGYNLLEGGCNRLHHQVTRDKISVLNRNNPKLRQPRPKIRQVINIYTVDGEYLDSILGLEECSKKYNIHPTIISKHLGDKVSCKGFYFTKSESFDMLRKSTESGKQVSKSIVCIEDNLEFESLTIASTYYNTLVTSISNNLKGSSKIVKTKYGKKSFKFKNKI